MLLPVSLFLSTFVLEDVALGSALVLVSQEKLSFLEAFLICSSGIATGDVGLYVLGRYASRFPFFRSKIDSPKFQKLLNKLKQNGTLDYTIVASRAIPGTRLSTYFAAGFMHYSASRFFSLTIVSVCVWVFAALYFGNAFFSFFHDQWVVALLCFLLIFSIGKRMLSLFKSQWSWKAMKYSWQKWLHFEFWPPWFFYLPIIPYYLFLSFRYRSLLVPFYSNPHVKHGGLIGESKWDFLKYLDAQSPKVLPAFVLKKEDSRDEVLDVLDKSGIAFPLVAKPDVGQRGYGVRVIKNKEALLDYLLVAKCDVIIQAKSQYPREAGVFFIRPRASSEGFIFSITDKKFPVVEGDGYTRLGDLILGDKRARIIASIYFERHQEQLDKVIPSGKKFVLAECGNHCQGAIFQNGGHLATPELLDAVENITCGIPDFYFGRIDIRFRDEDSLKSGNNFEVIEVNGAGAEATHIWDANTSLFEAYSVLFRQWSHLFAIGYVLKQKKIGQNPSISGFIVDCAKVYFRRGPLTTSS